MNNMMLYSNLSYILMKNIESVQTSILRDETKDYYDLCKYVEGKSNGPIGLDSKKLQEAKKAAKYLKWCLGEQKDRYKRFDETAEKIDKSTDPYYNEDNSKTRGEIFSDYKNLLDLAKEVITAWEWVDSAAIKLRQLTVECGITSRPQHY